MKQPALSLMRFVLAALIVVAQGANAVVILQYHHISTDTPPSTSLDPELFRWHMQHLSDAGYTVLSLPDVIADLKAGKALPNKGVVITFDDGYDSVYSEAFPVLKNKKWPFTVFVNTRPLENATAGFATWKQLQEMAKHGATIANHSHTHTHFLRREAGESERQWRQRIREDIQTAEELITERTGQAHKLLAYPYGEYNQAVKEIVDDLGFVAFGQQSGPVGDPETTNLDFLELPRFPFGGNYGSESDFRTKVATLAMPINLVRVLSKPEGKPVTDTVLPQNVAQPLLQIELHRSLPAPVQCFASGQGAIEVTVNGSNVETRAGRALPVGRSRYNCTSASDQAGRFYWYSHFFIRKRPDGSWYPEP